ncbi:hypothetical protein ABZ403_19325 [Micromonospora zamorensis]|uniref:hypothetical protein n=1 Tax=Micromonospora zamorensis TaxID=709883 RepID=UPI0034007626
MVDWHTQAEVGDDVIRISEPHVNELLSANFWWLRGTDRDLVIDAGLGVVPLGELYDKLGIDPAGEPVPELMLDALPSPGYDPASSKHADPRRP